MLQVLLVIQEQQEPQVPQGLLATQGHLGLVLLLEDAQGLQ